MYCIPAVRMCQIRNVAISQCHIAIGIQRISAAATQTAPGKRGIASLKITQGAVFEHIGYPGILPPGSDCIEFTVPESHRGLHGNFALIDHQQCIPGKIHIPDLYLIPRLSVAVDQIQCQLSSGSGLILDSTVNPRFRDLRQLCICIHTGIEMVRDLSGCRLCPYPQTHTQNYCKQPKTFSHFRFPFSFLLFIYLMYLCTALCCKSDIFSHFSREITWNSAMGRYAYLMVCSVSIHHRFKKYPQTASARLNIVLSFF